MGLNVKKSLDNLSRKDIYSLLMFVLFKSNEVPELATLSQLVYLLDEENFIKLIKYYSGQTIVIPTIDEFRELIHALVLYKDVVIDGIPFDKSIKSIPDELKDSVFSKFESIKSVMQEYSFV